jgi:hypothetical protein
MMTMNSKTVVLTLLCAAIGCDRSNAASGNGAAKSGRAAQVGSANPAAPKVTRIVFVGKEHACDCTRKTVDAGWAALQKALGAPAKVPVEKMQVDTEADKVAPYRQQKPMMALPALYFLDGKGAVLELLQGEVTAEQIAGVLAAKGAAPRADR